MKEERNIITMDGQGNISLPSDIGATAMTEWEICEPFGAAKVRRALLDRIIHGRKEKNDGIRVGCFGRQAQQLLESMMIYQHANISLW